MTLFLNLFLILTISFYVSADCGCLKCSKHLYVASPPNAPCKIIYRGAPESGGYCQPPLPYTVQVPVIPPPLPCIPKSYDYKITGFPLQMEEGPMCAYEYQVQAPVIPPPMPPTFLTGLVAKPDRIVLPAPRECLPHDQERVCNPVFPQPMPYQMMRPVPRVRPIIEKFTPNTLHCDCRYGNKRKRRSKRDLPILRNSVGFFMGLLPDFIKFPLQQTLKTWKYHQKLVDNQEQRFGKKDRYHHLGGYNPNYRRPHVTTSNYYPDFRQVPEFSQRFGDGTTHRFKSRGTLLQKLKSINDDGKRHKRSLRDDDAKSTPQLVVPLNDTKWYRENWDRRPKISSSTTLVSNSSDGGTERLKRSTLFDSGELQLPFFRVTDIENRLESQEDDSSEIESEEESGSVEEESRNRGEEFLQPLNFDQLLPQNPLFYLLNTPIRLLHHFHRLGRQISPVFKSVPRVFVSSKRYLRDFGRSFKNDVLDIASNLIGDFDEVDTTSQWPFGQAGTTSKWPFGQFGTTSKWPRSYRYRRSLPKERNSGSDVGNKVVPEAKLDVNSTDLTIGRTDSYLGDSITKSYDNVKVVPEAPSTERNNGSVVVSGFTTKRGSSETNKSGRVVPEKFHQNSGTAPRNNEELNNGTKKMEPFEPEYSLVFGGGTEFLKKRRKRYILKVVDEDEVQEFLREKLGEMAVDKVKKAKSKPKRKFVVEKLSPKIVIDNNGRPFMEINGVKRPLFLNRKPPNEEGEKPKNEVADQNEESKEVMEENMKEKIDNLIVKARERAEKEGVRVSVRDESEVSLQVVRDRVNQVIAEIQDLINMDFGRYSDIHNGLCKLQNFKNFVVDDWKETLIDEKSDDMASKIRILDNFREMQALRDDNVKNIAAILGHGNSFMTKKLIKMLVRLQKLQCIIARVVEDFGEKIKMGTKFDVKKEIKYLEFLSNLNFTVARTEHDFETDLKNERDSTVENKLKLLEKLRKFSENPRETYEQTKLLWEIGNIEKLQKDTITEMNTKIDQGQKVRKELKILFDLLRQLENCEEKQNRVLEEPQRHPRRDGEEKQKKVLEEPQRHRQLPETKQHRGFSHTYLEDKKPVKLVSNGYTLHAYKITD